MQPAKVKPYKITSAVCLKYLNVVVRVKSYKSHFTKRALTRMSNVRFDPDES